MKSADLLIAALENEGVQRIFGVPGEENLDVVEALRRSSIKLVLTRHEQAAAFMAATHGRLTGKAGVCLSTLGPGALNHGRRLRSARRDAHGHDHGPERHSEPEAGACATREARPGPSRTADVAAGRAALRQACDGAPISTAATAPARPILTRGAGGYGGLRWIVSAAGIRITCII